MIAVVPDTETLVGFDGGVSSVDFGAPPQSVFVGVTTRLVTGPEIVTDAVPSDPQLVATPLAFENMIRAVAETTNELPDGTVTVNDVVSTANSSAADPVRMVNVAKETPESESVVSASNVNAAAARDGCGSIIPIPIIAMSAMRRST
jgi:hypothetical protein